MYAVVKTGGKQYRVSKDDTIMVESIKAEAGSTIQLDDVMMLDDNGSVTIGTPSVEGAIVSAEVVKQARGPKLIIFRRKRRKNHRRIRGHRQDLTLLKILDISADGKTKTAAKKSAKTAEDSSTTAVKAAPKKAAAKKTTAKKAASAEK
ncbi:50S ribosomal protein L21 [Alphaproteobacteria bacterium]|jgi:large subunit ribosomal protein L21|nr:50S ribosomal protein L21 [Alphaproteobacteria bacterium]MDC0394232.1 50S ribosomal protein L21 [Alphaproteobacteria bacterium]